MRNLTAVITLAGAMCGPSAVVRAAGDDEAVAGPLVADAASRSSLVDAGTAGHDANGFFLASADQSYRLNFNGVQQFRYNMNFREDVPAPGEDFTEGFSNQRTTVLFDGVVAKDFGFNVSFNFADVNAGSPVLENAYMSYTISPEWAVCWGQGRFPVIWEDYIDEWKQLSVNSSPTDSVFSPGRVQGVWFAHTQEAWRLFGAMDDGAASANTDWDSPSEADYAFTARAEWMFAGDWGRFGQFSSWRDSEFAAKLGGAGHWQSGGSTGSTVGATADVDVFLLTGDLVLQGNGWNAFTYGVWRSVDAGGASGTQNDFGFLVQGGVFVTEGWEAFARYDLTVPDDNPGADDPSNTVTVGANYYFVPKSQAAKFSGDILIFLDRQADGITPASTSTGVLSDSTGDGQFAIQLQMQLLF